MTQTDKKDLTDRLNRIGLVTPTLPEGQAAQMDTVRDIPTLTEYIGQQLAIGGEAAINAGKGLLEAKQQLKHGEWQNWLAENFGLSDRQARRLMTLAQNYGDSKRTPVSVLGQRKALALLALPESERDGFLAETHQVNGEEKAVIDMTSRELEKAIKEKNELIEERDQARKAAEQAKADAKSAEEARASMEESLKEANELLDRARSSKELADGAVAALEQQLEELKSKPVDVAISEVDQEALDKARAEGEAAKEEEIAQLQDQLDKAREAKKKSDERRKNAEASVDMLKASLERIEKDQKQAVAMADPDIARLEIYFNQAKEAVNSMGGLLLKAKRREDQDAVKRISGAILILSDALKEAAQ